MGFIGFIGGFLGFMVGGPLGALAGFVIGSLFDGSSNSDNGSSWIGGGGSYDNSADEESYRQAQGQRNSFLFSLLVLATYIIRADGRVMHSEMEYVRRFLRDNFGEDAERQGNDIMLKLFEEQKRQDAQSPGSWKRTIRDCCRQISANLNESMLQELLHFLVLIAKADGQVPTSEVNALYEVAGYLGLSHADVDSMLHLGTAGSSGGSLEDAYKVLGLTPDATDDEVKAAYRRMALKHHPDRVATLGDDVKKAAEKKFQEINAAKDLIYKARGL